MATIAGHAYIPVEADMASFQRDVDRGVQGAISSASSSMQAAGRSMFRSGATVTAGLTVPIVAGFGAAINGASDLAETMSKSEEIFGQQAGAMERWSEGAAEGFGQSQQGALDAAATFGNMFTQLGLGSLEAAGMSAKMTELASDFASFHNADPTEVINAQAAAFRGEYDSLQRFLPLINAAAVDEEALAMSGKSTTDELTAQDRALAVNALMLEGAGAAMGDFDRTAGGAANQQRILRAQMSDAAATIGQQLLPYAVRLLDWVKQAVTWFSNLGSPMQGIIIAGAALLAVIGPIVTVVGALVTAIGVLISPVVLVIAGIAALAVGLYLAYQRFEGVRNVVDAVVQFFMNVVVPAIVAFAQGVADKFAELVAWVREHWAAIQEAIGHVLAVIQTIIATAIAVIQAAWSLFGDEILAYARIAWEQIRSYIETIVNVIAGVIEFVLAVINGDWGAAWDAIKGIAVTVWDFIYGTVERGVNAIKEVISAVLSGIGAVWDGIWNPIRDTFIDVWDAIEGAFSRVIGVIRSGWNALAGFWNSNNQISFAGIETPGPIPDIPGFSFELPDLPTLGDGGVITSRTLAWIGEDHRTTPEIVAPENLMRQIVHDEAGGGLTDDLLGRIAELLEVVARNTKGESRSLVQALRTM